MKMEEIRKQSDTDLQKFVSEQREAVRKLRFSGAGSGMRNTKEIATIKKDIARALTELTSRSNTNA